MRTVHNLLLSITALAFLAGCSMTMGNTGDKTHFAYPNSNVQPLGEVSSSFSKTTFLIPPMIETGDIKKLMEDALIQKPGSDLLINYKIDTTMTMFPVVPIYMLRVDLKGTASKMTVGLKELKELKSVY